MGEDRSNLSQNIVIFLKSIGINPEDGKTKFGSSNYRDGGGKMFYSGNTWQYVKREFQLKGKTIRITEKLTGRRQYWLNIGYSGEYMGDDSMGCHTQKKLKKRINLFIERENN